MTSVMDLESWVKILFRQLWRNDLANLLLDLGGRENDHSIVVFTPNLNHLRIVGSNRALREVYATAGYLICDGMPLSWISKTYFKRRITRISGVDLTSALMLAAKDIVVIGSSRKVVVDAYSRSNCDSNRVQIFDKIIDINQLELTVASVADFLIRHPARYVLLAVNTEKQALLVKGIVGLTPEIQRTFVGVGGSFDILSGKYLRAPRFIQVIGFEWLWRALQNPFDLFPRYFSDFRFVMKLRRIVTRAARND